MREFFSRKMGFGRYPDKTVAEVFCYNRPYFDQIVYKNAKFRQEYAQAFQQWVNDKKELIKSPHDLLLSRILLAIEVMGEDSVKELFRQLVKALNERWPEKKITEDLDFKSTLNGQVEGLEGYEPQLKQIELFWTRLAIPEAWLD
jgi:tRNA(Ile)-lysidine synthase TilS/MesJ